MGPDSTKYDRPVFYSGVRYRDAGIKKQPGPASFPFPGSCTPATGKGIYLSFSDLPLRRHVLEPPSY